MPRDKHLWIPTPDGAVARHVDAVEASTVSDAWYRIGRYLKTGNPLELLPIEGLTVVDVEIISDPERIEAYDESGEWDVVDETIYVEKPR